MSESYARKLTILNLYGINSRPAARILKTCTMRGPNTDVTISKDGVEVSGKSMMGLLTLEGIQGAQILVRARGPEARQVIEAITELVNSGFDTGESCLPIPPEHSQFLDP